MPVHKALHRVIATPAVISIRFSDAPANVKNLAPSPPAQRLARRFGAGALVIAVLVGIQLGSIPWRYRRQIWQLQGFLLGAAVGYGVGRFSRESRSKASRPGTSGGSGPTLPPPL